MNKPLTTYTYLSLYHNLLMIKKQPYDSNPQNKLMSLASKQSFFSQGNSFPLSESTLWPIFNNNLQKE